MQAVPQLAERAPASRDGVPKSTRAEQRARDLAEREADLEELVNLVSTKDELIKNIERRLLQAKKVIAYLKAEVQSLRNRNDHQEPDNQQKTPH